MSIPAPTSINMDESMKSLQIKTYTMNLKNGAFNDK